MKAVVLTGEGAKGAWQAQAFRDHISLSNKAVDFFVGVSSGAINAVGFTMIGQTKTLDIWKRINKINDVFGFNGVSALWKNGAFNSKPLEKMLRNTLGVTHYSQAVAYFPITSAEYGALRWCNTAQDSLIENVLAAVAIPGLVEDKDGYLDGGCRMLAPVSKAIEMGAKEVVVIMGRPYTMNAPHFKGDGLVFGGRWLKCAAYGYRFIDLLMHELTMRDIAVCSNACADVKITVLSPKFNVGDALDFHRCSEMMDLYKYPYNVTELTSV